VKVSATRIVLCVGAAVAIVGCGGDSDEGSAGTQATSTTPATATAPSATTPPEEPVTVQVNGESRTVTLSRVDSAYCAKKTDVCAALRGANYDRLSSEGKSAVRAARRRKAAREAEERQQELEQQQQQEQQQAPPQPQEEGTTTG
jgi:pyruvate/2-oxoglutarate dehydrogenase complex dihydrolipoamide acyltransferase (E2) component